MKKYGMKALILILVISLGIIGFLSQQTKQGRANNNGLVTMSTHFDEPQETVTPAQISDQGIVYTGKVIPQTIYYYQKDDTKLFHQQAVEEGQQVTEGQLLYDYQGQGIKEQNVVVLEKNFVTLQQTKDDLYARLAENQQWLDEENKWEGNEPYKTHLKNEIASLEGQIAQNKMDWLSAEEQIARLKEEIQAYQIYSEADGLVYKINEDNGIDPNQLSKTAYMTLYSQSRMIRIEVSEFEYMHVKEGLTVEVEVEGLNKTFEGTIHFVDTMPNNLESQETSYYYVEIAVPDEIPYGYSAIVTVPLV